MPSKKQTASLFPRQQLLEIRDGLHQALFELDLGFPAEFVAGEGDVGLALGGVVAGQGLLDDFRFGAGHGDDFFGQLADGEFVGVAEVAGAGEVSGRFHQADEAVDHVVDVAERAALAAVAVDGDGLVLQRLDDEVGDDAAVVGVHARAVGVEDARDLDFQLVLAVVVEEQGFGAALAFIVAGADADRVDVAPVVLGLRVNRRVAVNLAGGSLEDARLQALGQAEHVDGAMHRGLGGLHRVVLIVNGRGGAGQVVDFVDFHIQREGDVVTHELEARMVVQVVDVALGAGEQVVQAQHFMALFQQLVAQVRTEEAGAAGDENTFA